MRILLGLLAIALLTVWGPVAPAQAQCDPSECTNPNGAKSKAAGKMKARKQVAAKKQKQPTKELYMKAAPY